MRHALRRLGTRSVKSLAASLPSGLSVGRRWLSGGRQASGQVLILGYHRVVADVPHAEDDTIAGMAISRGTFRRHMELLLERCEIVPLSTAASVLRGEAATRRPAVVITFDDGYRDVYEHAWPILRELGLPATIFVSTAFINTTEWLDHDLLFWFARRADGRGFDWSAPLVAAGVAPRDAEAMCIDADVQRLARRLNCLPLARRRAVISHLRDELGEPTKDERSACTTLGWDEIRSLAEGGITFGAHTEHHPILPLEEEQVIAAEVERSQRTLAGQLGRPVRHFAYPDGRYNGLVTDVVRRFGFETAVSTQPRFSAPGTDLMTLGRLCLCEESTRGVTGRFSETVARLRLAV